MNNSTMALTAHALESVSTWKAIVDQDGANLDISGMKEMMGRMKATVSLIIDKIRTTPDLTEYQITELNRLSADLANIE